MKIDLRSFKFANCFVRNRHLPIPFYIPEKKEKLSPFSYQVYSLQINHKDKSSRDRTPRIWKCPTPWQR
eukprot:9589553-Ditylum_brightwellii.AAC.1